MPMQDRYQETIIKPLSKNNVGIDSNRKDFDVMIKKNFNQNLNNDINNYEKKGNSNMIMKNNKKESMKQAQKKYRKTLQRDHKELKGMRKLIKQDKQELIKAVKKNHINNSIKKQLINNILDVHKISDILALKHFYNTVLPLIQEINQSSNIKDSDKPEITNAIIKKYYSNFNSKQSLDTSYLTNLSNTLTNQIKSSNLDTDTKTMLMNIIIDAENTDARTNRDKVILQACANVRRKLPLLLKLQNSNDIFNISHYVLNIITHPASTDNILSLRVPNSHATLQGNRMLDFIANEKDIALEYTKEAKTKILQKSSSNDLNTIKNEVSFIFGDKMERLMGFFKLQVENFKVFTKINQKYHINVKPFRNLNVSEAFLLDVINHLMNYYLIHCHLIKATYTGYHLTSLGVAFANPYISTNLINTILSKHPLHYQSRATWSNVITNCIKPLRWISNHSSYQNYYGLAFALSVLSIHNFETIDDFKYHGKTYSLNITPLTYLSIIFQILYSVFYGNKVVIDTNSARVVDRLKNVEKNVYKYYQKLNK